MTEIEIIQEFAERLSRAQFELAEAKETLAEFAKLTDAKLLGGNVTVRSNAAPKDEFFKVGLYLEYDHEGRAEHFKENV